MQSSQLLTVSVGQKTPPEVSHWFHLRRECTCGSVNLDGTEIQVTACLYDRRLLRLRPRSARVSTSFLCYGFSQYLPPEIILNFLDRMNLKECGAPSGNVSPKISVLYNHLISVSERLLRYRIAACFISCTWQYVVSYCRRIFSAFGYAASSLTYEPYHVILRATPCTTRSRVLP